MPLQFGRKKILRDEVEVTADNVEQILRDVFSEHLTNSQDCETLYQYYRGNQPISQRTKEIRPEICNRIVENRANEIVTFKTGYLCGEPLQYVSRSETEGVSEEIGKLNDLMALCGKPTLDKELAEWMYICGTGYRIILPNARYINTQVVPKLKNRETPFAEDEAPFSVYTLDPCFSFVVYHSGLGEPPLMGVKYVVRRDGTVIYSVWTPTTYFELVGNSFGSAKLDQTKMRANSLGYIPLVEYPLNNARLGVFEPVIPILNAINTVQSNRLDGVEQFIQALIVLYNADIDEDAAKNLRSAGLIKLKSFGDNKADIKELVSQLDQQQTQTLTDYMYQTVLDIVGMPNRNSGGTNDANGVAVLAGNGFYNAEARAKGDELMFKLSETQFLQIALRIMRDTVGTGLKLSEIDTHFTRRNYEGIQSKSQVLVSLLQNEKVHPQLAFEVCGLFSDAESAYLLSNEYYEANKSAEKPAAADTKGGGAIA